MKLFPVLCVYNKDPMRARLLLRCSLVLFASLACLASLRAQEAGKIIEQYVKAAGGSGKLSKLQTLSLEGTLTRVSDGKTGTFTLDIKTPSRYYMELIAGDQPEILAYNGKSAWHLSASGGPTTLLGQDALELEAASFLATTHLMNLKKSKVGAAFISPAKVGSRDALEIEITMPTAVKRQFFFDSRSHLLLKETGGTGGVPQEMIYDDYRPENGIPIAHKLELHRGNETYNVVVNRVSLNQNIGERVFDFPIKSQVRLPDLKKLFAEIDANQKVVDKIKENYTGRRATEETQFDASGKVTKIERQEYTFFYLNGEEISTLVGEEGKPLSEQKQAKQNEITKKRIEEVQKEQAKKDEKEKKAKEQGKEEKDKDKDEPGIEMFLRACQFVNPRHERFRGQDVLVFDFEGNPEYKPKNIAEHVAQQLAGVIWVDEKQHEVVRLEAYFVKDFRFAGGLLANLQKGTSFIFEQTFLNNEVWLPTYEEAHVGVRVLLVKGFKINEVTRYSDYQRFHIETLSTIAKPKEPADTSGKEP
jgi:outer membrane lipoprotein-sorting protein